MNLFQKFFKVIQSFLHGFLNHIQDPILMAEQAIRDLKKDYDTSMKNLAEIKALSIEAKEKISQNTEIAKDYEKKALVLLQKAQNGELEQEKADRLASEALKKKQEAIEEIKKQTLSVRNYDSMSEKLETKISGLKEQMALISQTKKNPPSKGNTDLKLAVGDRIQDTKFGQGTVLRAEAMGNDYLLEIAFDDVGTKKLMARYRQITKL